MLNKKKLLILAVLFAVLFPAFSSIGSAESFNYKKYLSGAPNSTLSTTLQSIDTSTGIVIVGGSDSKQPDSPFTFEWGDGTSTNGWFPETHTYQDKTTNYIVKVTSHYHDGTTDQAEAVVLFTTPRISPISLPSDVAVTIPATKIALQSRMSGYAPPTTLTYFDDSFFTTMPRSTVEYILTAAAAIQKDFVNDNVFLNNGKFEQVMLRDPSFSGMYSLWFTNPVSFGAGNYGFQGNIEWSSFMHEMGHNFTLNTPYNYFYGGKIDGNANAIYSETMAQIFAHATAYELVNNYKYYGLSEELATAVKQNATASIVVIRNSYEDYLSSGKQFSSWNDPNTQNADETVNTFMTIAYKFIEHAEQQGAGYRLPLKRMSSLLQTFDKDLAAQFDQSHNTQAATTFRSTLMVTALSYAFGKDLREEFRNLNFPVDDHIYEDLYKKAPAPMSVPSSPDSLSYAPIVFPIVGSTSAQSEPLAVGSVATGSDMLNLQITLNQFTGPVDIYFLLFLPAIDPNNVYQLTSLWTLQPLSMGLAALHQNVSGPLSESLLGDIPASWFPPGQYFFALLVTPAGDQSLTKYYLWVTAITL